MSELEKKTGMYELFQLGTAAIPYLVEEIDRGDIVPNLLQSPLGSIVTENHTQICTGAYAAYVIEMILALDQIDKTSFFTNAFFFGSELKNYLFLDGFIVYENNECVSKNKKEMKRIAQIYREWWEQNSSKSLPQLKAEWKQGRTPLSGSGYQWK